MRRWPRSLSLRWGESKRGGFALTTLLGVALVSGCSTRLPEGPRIDAITPASTPASALPLNITVRGSGFYLAPRVSFDDPGAPTSPPFRLWLGDIELNDVRFINVGELRARVPEALEKGRHALRLVDPRGREAVQEGAFRVGVAPADAGNDVGAHDGAQSDASQDAAGRDGQADGELTDAPPNDIDASSCPPICRKCTGGTCEIDCAAGGCTCPPGMPCRPVCRKGECNGIVDCSKATTCNIDCQGQNACTGNVVCGSGACVVSCGPKSCRQQVDCSKAGDCKVQCASGACLGNVVCGSGSCEVTCAAGACQGEVDGSRAGKVSVNCSTNACAQDVRCGSGMCVLDCASTNACQGAVDCSSACGCSVDCLAGSNCATQHQCPAKCASSCGPTDGCSC